MLSTATDQQTIGDELSLVSRKDAFQAQARQRLEEDSKPITTVEARVAVANERRIILKPAVMGNLILSPNFLRNSHEVVVLETPHTVRYR